MKLLTKYWTFTIFGISIVLIEVALRLILGLGNPPIVVADREMGYRFEENQKLRRFGNRLEYNQYSQRSDPIPPQKAPQTLRILMLGDSVLNGGNSKDQTETISEMFKAKIARTQEPVEVLNASANSWGVGNQLGYLRKFGTLDSDAVILQIGTHDLVQVTLKGDRFSPPARPKFALQEAIVNYAWPRLPAQLRSFPTVRQKTSQSAAETNSKSTSAPRSKDRQFQINMENFQEIATLVRAQRIPLLILYTPDRRDLLPTPNQPTYKSQFFQYLKTLDIPAIDSHLAWSSLPAKTVESYFTDGVHLSVAGNQAIADLLFQQVCVSGKIEACRVPSGF